MNRRKFIVILFLLILIAGTGIVSGETINGTLGQAGILSQTCTTVTWVVDQSSSLSWLTTRNMENTENPFSIVTFMDGANLYSFDADAPPSAWTTVTVRLENATPAARILGNGTLGYQRVYNYANPPVEQPTGFIYLNFVQGDWNISGLTGTKTLYLVYNHSALYNLKMAKVGNPTGPEPLNWIGFAGTSPGYSDLFGSGQMVFNRYTDVWSYYEAVKPSGLMIAGYVLKKNSPEGTFTYNSRTFITDSADNVITSDITSNPNTFNFTVPNEAIKIKMLAPSGVWYNSPLLFSSANQTIPGVYNITFHVKTRSGSDVPNAHVSFMYDSSQAYGGTVSGYTNTSGMISFGSVPGAAAAIVDVTASGFPEYIETFTMNQNMVKIITLSSPSISLYLDVKDSSNGAYINGVDNIGIKNVSSGVWRNTSGHNGAIYFDSTGANYDWPISLNETVIVAADEAGYRSAWESVIIHQDRQLVTLKMVNLNGTAPTSGNFTAVIAVSDLQDSKPLIGASLSIQEIGRMSSTNSAGVGTFRNVPVGTYTVQASATGYSPSSTTITGTEMDTLMTSIRLIRDGCSLSDQDVLTCNGTPCTLR